MAKPKSKSFFQSHAWKNLITRLYSFGAALVIIGALFKLQHWPYAGVMLSIGMFTEFVIFMLSGFDPPPVEYHWEKAYPELMDDVSPKDRERALESRLSNTYGTSPHVQAHAQATGMVATPGMVAAPAFSGLDVDPALAAEIKSNMAKFNDTIKSMNNLSAIAEASNNFIGGMQQAAGSVDALNKSINTMGDAYKESTQVLLTGGKQTGANIDLLNKHMATVNASYELYIQEHKQYVATSEQLVNSMKHSAERSVQFSDQMDKLTGKIGELNTIYGSMISTVNTALKR